MTTTTREQPPAIEVETMLEPEDLERLLQLLHSDPHSVLGAHATPGGVVVRTFRPNAEQVLVLRDGKKPNPLKKVHEAGIFEALFPGDAEVFAYRLEVSYAEGRTFTLRDPFTFLPTIGDVDLHLFGEGSHEQLYQKLGAHHRLAQGVPGVSFAVWAPNAKGVSVVGDFNGWDGRLHPMRNMGSSGVWEIFIPDLEPGTCYKYEIRTGGGSYSLRADPFAFATEVPPETASRVYRSEYTFEDAAWMKARRERDLLRQPISIYELHLGSWRRSPEEGNRPLNYRELADALGDYMVDMGFTHVELLPITEHPFGGSWGYQTTSYFAPTSRFGEPDDFKYLVDKLHQRGIGVILDWAPAHFPKDDWALGRFDGTALFEHLDPRKGEHPDWGTFIFNYDRNEVRNFLLASALYWLKEFHIDGLRLDAVASMLYLDYSRKEGEWVPNEYGGRENLGAVALLRQLNEIAHGQHPGALMIAEESTAWPGVSRPTYLGGLGFGYKWNMGWMHDTLEYFSKDPVHRRFHHHHLTFGLLYAWSENFILPLSHDEVVHGKGSLLGKMPGDRWQQLANLRALFGYMWAHPGKQMLFMGGELGQWSEWNHDQSVDWHLLDQPEHRGVQQLVRDLNRVYQAQAALWDADSEPVGFQWIDVHNADENVIAFMRISPRTGRRIVCVCNLSPVPRRPYRLGLPELGQYTEILNTDAAPYGGSNVGNEGVVHAEPVPWHSMPYSGRFILPPLATIWFEVP